MRALSVVAFTGFLVSLAVHLSTFLPHQTAEGISDLVPLMIGSMALSGPAIYSDIRARRARRGPRRLVVDWLPFARGRGPGL